ncbi:Stp1/IreP family PP2C-type Ser/Thr phosphatase [Paenisporosarcina sp. TG20]|uniref:Stp1/IreP family PP2C-type Ser/Thr phosphatase n=1 Tax=Paenisporosarcina sp. TG20 TaxID=1211706 RepID=UPI0002DF33F7|nr:Stp1/IreP family PP2C-type Ser/Thr phosphatase [Paenisporosarcina sp. TG20]
MKYTVLSDIGQKRSVNEDCAAMFVRPDFVRLGVIADGMGGHNAGDVASNMAVTKIGEYFENASSQQFSSEEAIKHWFIEAVKNINSLIFDYSLTHEDCQGMGTTFLAVVLTEDQKVLCHIGDSRAYEWDLGDMKQITKDHSYVNVLVENGEISPEEAERHPRKNLITKSLGTEKTIEPDFISIMLPLNSYLLLCSDGLSNKLTVDDMANILLTSIPVSEKASQLVQLANTKGGEDNISLVLITNTQEEV